MAQQLGELEQEPELKLRQELEPVLLDFGQAAEELARLLLELPRARKQHQFVVRPLEKVELLGQIALKELAE